MSYQQTTNIKVKYKAMTTRRRAIILDSVYSLDALGLVRELDELGELTLALDRLAEELRVHRILHLYPQ